LGVNPPKPTRALGVGNFNISPDGKKDSSWLLRVQWVDRYIFWLLVLDSRDSKQKLEVSRLGEVVQNRFQKMNMKK
jgi:hypothetical protein